MKPLPEPTTYLIRDIDPALWARFKARSEAAGVPMRALLLQLVTAYADGAVQVQHTTTVTAHAVAPRRRKGGAK